MSRLHLVVNRNARDLRGDGPLLRALIDESGGMRVHETRSLDDLDAVARTIADAGADAVILAGGDGGYMAGVTALRRTMGDAMPKIALAPGGTVSTVAKNWGMRGPRADYARRLMRAIARGDATTTERPSLRVTDDRGGDRVSFIFGAGLVARFFDAYYAAPEQGLPTAAKLVGRIFVGSPFGGALAKRVLSPVPCSLAVDAAPQHARAYSLVVASVVRDLGLGMRVTYRAGEDPCRVHLVASPLGAPRLGPQMPLVLAGKRLRGAHHVDALATTFTLRFEAQDAYVLDGELLAAREVSVAAGPTLRVLGV